jgi:hypothetical protein
MKNNMDYFKTMNEKDLDLTKTAVDWTDKAFRGNGDCAAIARTTGKTCKVVLRDGEDTSFLEGIHSQRSKKEQPDIFNRYSKNVSSRRFTIIHAA